MLLREWIDRCPVCEETTPHSRRTIAFPRIIAAAAALLTAWCFWRGELWLFLAGLALPFAVITFAHDREKYGHVRCERCRGKKLAELRRTKPRLDGNTEIGSM